MFLTPLHKGALTALLALSQHKWEGAKHFPTQIAKSFAQLNAFDFPLLERVTESRAGLMPKRLMK